MFRTVERLRLAHADDEELEDGLEKLGGLIERTLGGFVVRKETEQTAAMIDELTGSDDTIDRDFACALLVRYHRCLADRDAVADPEHEVARWRRLIDNEPPGKQKDWFQTAPELVEDSLERMPFTENNYRFQEALRSGLDL